MKQLSPGALAFTALSFIASSPASAQDLPTSGVTGYDLVYATSPGGTSQLYAINVFRALHPIPVGAPVQATPSRWAHRRRILGALETAIASPVRGLFLTPLGDSVGNGAIHMVDLRLGSVSGTVATGNPAAYDLAVMDGLGFVFAASDDGAGNTRLSGFSYATPGVLVPLTPPVITIPGLPAAYVNRIGVDARTGQLHVPTSTGVQVVFLSPTAPNMIPATFMSVAPATVTTNPARFVRNGQTTWIVGTSTFDVALPPQPDNAAYFAWDAAGNTNSGTFGSVPSAPLKNWVPAVGTEELAVVGNGVDTYVYYLLREPAPGTFFVKPSAVGVVRFLASAQPDVATIAMTNEVGEPFAVPAVHAGRVAFESSYGPPFSFSPAGGGETLSLIYSPLDIVGSATTHGLLGAPVPLGGRISTKGMDRPIWTRDGTRVMAATSHFPGAPNPGVPGIEVLNVPADVPLDVFTAPHTVVNNLPFPNQSIIYPATYQPRDPSQATLFANQSYYGSVFNQGMASIAAPAWGELGQLQVDPTGFTQSRFVPDFPSILQRAFNDTVGSTTVVPSNFGARRATFNSSPAGGFVGLTMSAAIDDGIYVQMTGQNILASFLLTPALAPIRVGLPAGWTTTSEFYSF